MVGGSSGSRAFAALAVVQLCTLVALLFSQNKIDRKIASLEAGVDVMSAPGRRLKSMGAEPTAPVEHSGRRLQGVAPARASRLPVELVGGDIPHVSPEPRPKPGPPLTAESPELPEGGTRTGGARPATVPVVGPTELPIDQSTLTTGYAPGTGQLTDPLSCMYVDPSTGTLYFKCKVSFQPVPWAASAPPPPKWAAARAAVIVAQNAGSAGLLVVGETGNTETNFGVFKDGTSTTPLARVRRGSVQLAPTLILGNTSPEYTGAALMVVGDAPSTYPELAAPTVKSALEVYHNFDQAIAPGAAPPLYVRNSQVTTGKLNVYHANSPLLPGAALFVEGLTTNPSNAVMGAAVGAEDPIPCFLIKNKITAAGRLLVDANIGPNTAGPVLGVNARNKAGLVPMQVSQSGSKVSLGVLADGSVLSAPLEIDARLVADGVQRNTLTVTGTPTLPTIVASSDPDSVNVGLYLNQDTLQLGPTTILGIPQSTADAVLLVANPMAGKPLIAAYSISDEVPDLVLKSGALTVPPTTVNGTGAAAPALQVLGAAVASQSMIGSGVAVGSGLSVGGQVKIDGKGVSGPALQVTGSTAVSGALAARNLATTGPAKFGGDVTIGTNVRGQQRSLTVNGKLTVKLDALFERSVEVWRSMTARYYFWWRPNRRHYPFTAPAENKPTGGSRKLA